MRAVSQSVSNRTRQTQNIQQFRAMQYLLFGGKSLA